MALITRYALSKPEFVSLINTKSVHFSSDRRSYSFANKNRLLNEYEGANGVKTGFTGKAGHCFVGAAQRGDMELISVVLASGWGRAGKEGKWTDTKALLNYGFKNFKYETIIADGKPAGLVPVTRSRTETVKARYSQGLVLPLSEDERQNINVVVRLEESVKAPIPKGAHLCEARVSISGQLAAVIPIVSVDEAERHDYKTSLEKILASWLTLGTEHEVKTSLPEFSLPWDD
jgi:D-alanyl-D-alanine carboxypeptidase (penicillin-binding protein 5/6)